jgi:hypothetical protein
MEMDREWRIGAGIELERNCVGECMEGCGFVEVARVSGIHLAH